MLPSIYDLIRNRQMGREFHGNSSIRKLNVALSRQAPPLTDAQRIQNTSILKGSLPENKPFIKSKENRNA